MHTFNVQELIFECHNALNVAQNELAAMVSAIYATILKCNGGVARIVATDFLKNRQKKTQNGH
jgi:hypothetical protein